VGVLILTAVVMLLTKKTNSTGSWVILDSMRGFPTRTVDNAKLYPDTSGVESGGSAFGGGATADGFSWFNDLASQSYIYMAIRAPMMKEPEAATEVFAPFSTTQSSAGNVNGSYYFGFSPDFTIQKTTSVDSSYTGSRLTGNKYLNTDSSSAETTTTAWQWDLPSGSGAAHQYSSTYGVYGFKRAKGFFDVVAYTGNGVNSRAIGHNLGVKPELMLIKSRSGAYKWNVYHESVGATGMLVLNTTAGTTTDEFNDIEPTSTTFSLSLSGEVNGSTITYIAYLFATLAGVSKVGSYTGNGSSQNIACGFSAGARFVMIKRTDSTGDWYIWDTERGIVAGNDPHLSLNTTAAEVTTNDSIDPQSAGFTVNQVTATNINVSSGEYIFLAIA